MAKDMITPIIRFNLKERMRQFSGKERKFDIPKLVKIINSEHVQERVRLGDLNGFYGHHARIQFGAEPQEGGIVDGKYVHLEPCCRTIYLKAYDDGTVEHQQEFFATELGSKAWQRLQDKSGGFSSVISMKNGGDFHGFDYVNEPNFSANRPYTLDSANWRVSLSDHCPLALRSSSFVSKWYSRSLANLKRSAQAKPPARINFINRANNSSALGKPK